MKTTKAQLERIERELMGQNELTIIQLSPVLFEFRYHLDENITTKTIYKISKNGCLHGGYVGSKSYSKKNISFEIAISKV